MPIKTSQITINSPLYSHHIRYDILRIPSHWWLSNPINIPLIIAYINNPMLQHASGLLHRGLLRRTLCRRRWGRLLWNETAILPAMRIPRYSYRLPRFWHVLIAMFYHVLTQGLTEDGIYCTTNSLKNAILGYHGVPYFQTHPLDVFFWCVTWHQWPFQEPKLEVPTIYRACIRPM
jgi:hypothetical protein